MSKPTSQLRQELAFLNARASDISNLAQVSIDEVNAGTYTEENKRTLVRRVKELLAIAEEL